MDIFLYRTVVHGTVQVPYGLLLSEIKSEIGNTPRHGANRERDKERSGVKFFCIGIEWLRESWTKFACQRCVQDVFLT